MAINLSDNVRIGQQLPVDSRYLNGLSTWSSLQDAKTGILTAFRFQGLTINISGVEYWWRDGILDEQLVIKTVDVTLNLQEVTDQGATTSNSITALSFIKNGGTASQFLKADGTIDNNIYLTSTDLPSTLDLFFTTSPDPDIENYTVLVRNITDTRYNTEVVNFVTPVIDGTELVPTLCASIISDSSILSGNPGIFNFTLIGDIRCVGGATFSGADFFYTIYKRDISGYETKIVDSAKVSVSSNNISYYEYILIALWNNGNFLSTDRVVIKIFGIKTTDVTGTTYEFQFGGSDPFRGTAAVSSVIIPNLHLKDLVDVEKVSALNKEVLYWNDNDSLWEHSLTENLVPTATSTQKGIVSTTAQTFAGSKTFTNTITVNGNIIATTAPVTSLGSYNILTRNTSTGIIEKIGATEIQPLIYNILIQSTIGITTQTLGVNNGEQYSQEGRNVMIDNGTTEIIVTATNASNSFIASYTKLGTANITFASNPTPIAPYGVVLNGNPGSTALLTKNGTSVYLLVNNLL